MGVKETFTAKVEYTREQRIIIVKMLITDVMVTVGLYVALGLLLNHERSEAMIFLAAMVIGMTAGLVGLTWATKIPPKDQPAGVESPKD